MNILITGHTSGLGLAIAEYYLDNNATVFGLSRSFSESKHPRLSERKVDLSSPETFVINIHEHLLCQLHK